MTNIIKCSQKSMEKILLQLTTQSRKRKIKDENDLLEFYKPYKKRRNR